ncbi:hypothetical protein ACFQH2_08050 [Natronoarchaeum sp. GCM10025703]
MEDNNSGKMEAFLKNHPRMIGALFTILLALSQVGGAAAAMAHTID